MEIQSEIGYLEHVQQNIFLKNGENTLSSTSTNLTAADNKSGITLRKHLETKVLPDPKSPYFTRIDLATGEIIYYGHIMLSPAKNSPPIPQTHLLVDYFLTHSRNSDEKGWSVHPITSFKGEVLRRVRFEIREGEITDLREELFEGAHSVGFEVLASEQLERAINQTREVKLKPVGATLQPDQFDLTRESSESILAIQGPPGSGKTVVLLERMSRIAFANRSIKDNGMLLIGPNSQFLEYVSDAMEILGNPEIITSTIEELTRWKIDAAPDVDEIQIIKGIVQMESLIDNCISDLPQTINEKFTFQVGDFVAEFTPLDSFLLLESLDTQKSAYTQIKDRASGQIINLLTERILGHLDASGAGITRFTEDPGQVIQKSNEFRRLIRTMFPEVSADSLLKRLKYSSTHFIRYSKGLLEQSDVVNWMKFVVPEAPCIRISDIPLLDYLNYRINGREMSLWGHIAVDEVQDFTPMQSGILRRRIERKGTFSLSGDLAQATGPLFHESWADIVSNFSSETEFNQRQLTTSYRVPKQILAYARKFLEKSEVSVKEVKPFLDVEDALKLEAIDSVQGMKNRIDDLITDQLLQERSVLLISNENLRHQYADLHFDATGNAHFKSYHPEDVKGLEFDVVIIADPLGIMNEVDMPLGRLARLFYVLTTRSTKQLYIIGNSEDEVNDPIEFFLRQEELAMEELAELMTSGETE
jgi:DNA helicase IV